MGPTEVMDQFFAGYAAGDLDAVASLVHPDGVIRESDALPFGGDYVGPDGFRTLIGAMLRDFDFEVLSREDLPAGDTLVIKMGARFTARHSGEQVELPVVELYTVRDGLIVEADVYYKDPGAVAAMLVGAEAV